jgi:RHS repeat-associated protein
MMNRSGILLFVLVSLAAVRIAAAPHPRRAITGTWSLDATCPLKSQSPPRELFLDDGVYAVKLSYMVVGGMYPTQEWSQAADYLPCAPSDRTWGTDTLGLTIVNEQAGVVFDFSASPPPGSYTPEPCEVNPYPPVGVVSNFTQTLNVSGLTATGPHTLTILSNGCNTHPQRPPGNNNGAWIEATLERLPFCETIAQPAPSVTAKKTSQTTVDVVVDYDFPANSIGRRLILKTAAWTDAKGRSYPEQVIHNWGSGVGASGPFSATVTMPFASRQVRLLAEARYTAENATCEVRQVGFGAIDCDTCNSSVGDPISVVDGNMRYVDTDPLPPILDRMLTRTFDSGHGQDGYFGIGWTTLFDQSINVVRSEADAPELVHFTTPENETVAFFGDGTQVWPPNVTVPATFTEDAIRYGAHAYRPAGGRYATLFDLSFGLCVGLRDVVTGRELQVSRSYNLDGTMEIVAYDSWTQTNWSMNVVDNLVQTIDGPSGTWTYHYTPAGYLTSVDGPGGVWRTYTYGTGGMTEARDGAGHLLEMHQYDSAGRAITSIGPSDEIANIEYDLPGSGSGTSKTRITTGGGAVIETILYPVGGAHRVLKRQGGCSSCGTRDEVVAYDRKGRVVRRQDASGYITSNAYSDRYLTGTTAYLRPSTCDPAVDPNHCRLESADLASVALTSTSASVTSTYTFGDEHWPDKPTVVVTSSVRQSGGFRTETRTYDETTGQVLSNSVTGWSGNSVAAQQTRTTTTSLYDGSEGAVFDPGGSFVWPQLPQPTFVKRVDGPRGDVSDVTAYVYYPTETNSAIPADARGRLAATRNAAGHITRFEDYDVFGNARRVTDPNGVVSVTVTDAIGRVVSSTIEAAGNCDSTADPICDTDLTTTRVFDALGPLTSEERPAGGVTVFTYDARGRVQSQSRGPSTANLQERMEIDYDPATGKRSQERFLAREGASWPEKRRESYSYDGEARLSVATHADSTTLAYTYDHAGRVATVRDENHVLPNTTYAYDPAGHLNAVVQRLAGVPDDAVSTRYTYDRHGNLAAVTDPNGNLTSYLYDDFGQMLRQESPVTGVTEYTYDAAGDLTRTTDANGATTERAYDALGRVTHSDSDIEDASETVAWTYDTGAFGIGRLASMTDPTGSTAYRYERRGLLARELKTIGTADHETRFRYDVDGNRSSTIYPTGRVVTQTFDYAGRPVAMTAGSVSIAAAASYLPYGPMKSVQLGNGTTRTMTFDARYRPLTNALTRAAGMIASYAYGYDGAGNVTSMADSVDASYSRSFGYDDLNRLTTADSGASLWGTGAFAYDAMGNLQAATLGSSTTLFTYSGTTPKLSGVTEDGVARPVSYDAAGNESSTGASPDEYSPRNHLRRSGVVEYGYDGRGVRTVAIAPAVLSAFSLVDTIGGGRIAEGRVTLDQPAPAGGVVVSLTSSGEAAGVPATVTVAAGAAEATFPITTVYVEAPVTVTITATSGSVALSRSLEITPPALDALEVDLGTISGEGSATGTFTLTAPAPAGGLTVELTSSNPALIPVPSTIVIPAGADQATFTVTPAAPVATPVQVTITITYHGVSRQVVITVVPPPITGVTMTPPAVEGGGQVSAVVTLQSGAAAGTQITFSSSNPAVPAPPTATMSAGATTVQSSVTTAAVTSTQTSVVTATLAPTSATASVTVNPPSATLQSVTMPASVIGSNTVTGTVTLTGAAPGGGIDVELSNFESGLVPPYVHVAAGTTQATFPIATELVATTETRSFNARFGGTVIAKTLQVLPPDGVIDLMLDEPGTLSMEGERRVGGSLMAMWLTVTPGSNTTATPTVTSSQYVFQFDEEQWPDPTWQRWIGRPALSVTQPTDVMVTAEYDGMVDRQRVVLLPSASTVSLESVGVDAVIGGSSATGAVALSDVAPAGGITVTLTGSRAGLATVPASVTVPAGETSATFTVTTSATATQRGALVQASYGAQVRTAILAVNPPPSAIAPVPSAAAENVRAAAAISAPIGPFGMASATVGSASILSSDTEPDPTTRSFLYTPELNLLAETSRAVSNPETIAYEYLWFAGQPIAQITTATNEIAWYFNDHLGTPILQTDATANVIWRIEREPYGRTFATRTGATRHQPLAFPGQEEQGGETAYNIFRWYRAGWGRYTQADPIDSGGLGRFDGRDTNQYAYVSSNSINFVDPTGLDRYILIVGDPGLGEHNVGNLFQRAADTDAGTLRAAGHDVDIVRASNVTQFGSALVAGPTITGGVRYYGHSSYDRLYVGEGAGAGTNIDFSNASSLSGRNLGPHSEVRLNSCYAGSGNNESIASELARILGRRVKAHDSDFAFSNRAGQFTMRTPKKVGPIYMVPNPNGTWHIFN